MLSAPERFSDDSRKLVEAIENELYLSAASAWEIAIKYQLGKLQLPSRPAELIPELMSKTTVVAWPIRHSHGLRVAELLRTTATRSIGCWWLRRSWKGCHS